MGGRVVATIGFVDIETTGLKPQHHRFLTMAIARNLEPDPWLVVNVDDREIEALYTARTWLYQLDTVVTWGGNYFDLPFLNYRLAVHNMERIALPDHFDMKAWAKRVDPFGFMRSPERYLHGMEAHAKHVGIATKDTPFDPVVWGKASSGDVDALVEIANHNVEDVQTLRSLYDKLVEPVDERKRQLGLF
jgi:uncharacterized protein YprB with RNaseH-like and TPR domain